ncbi:zinc-binding metallopeptidase family protein [Humisphaera borealis]|uniref:Putative zinc-binding metallopeptidase n=1 Tax=Humisphaera borealis TaxID=2807512 RepID=A0A7M2WTY3_9BACT|nr:putative zinc-binding metallopeptidase [Humisphaera borealis]QOV88985.1 putative zinc-binding metallopeptidase [Humisphaera borealis]
MERSLCKCGNVLFFESSVCVRCQRDVGWCTTCGKITSLEPHPQGGFTCNTKGCGAHVAKCENYATYDVCNRTIPADKAEVGALCDYCRFNRTIPNLDAPDNKVMWARIEAAKRRVLYGFDRLGLVYGTAEDGVVPPLMFDFKTDGGDGKQYRDVAGGEQVFTGHDNGVITLNLKEADPVLREKSRVEFGEAHRTLVGHFRHEMGHYIWDVMVKGQREPECVALFGDHNAVAYADALNAYYQNGPKADWPTAYVSGYATMHPWEDFAETFANYLDLMATIESARDGKMTSIKDEAKFDDLTAEYVRLGIVLNELNRGIGLIDFLPEVIVEPVKKKMAFVHSLTKLGKKR